MKCFEVFLLQENRHFREGIAEVHRCTQGDFKQDPPGKLSENEVIKITKKNLEFFTPA